ncbi:hypothetical protein [Nitrosopumilus sp.]|uniref:hypothetical protein n=1 Tax=Nitrosopumilus sp. TaxID=2024843 RepID=UPI00292D1651|nr:hypothetical protein [Nitrosopumilus sp.]
MSNSSKIMIVFLLFGFLFLSSNLETQVFASYDDGNIKDDVQTIDNSNNPLQEPDPPTDDDTEKEGIDEDWMFGKTKHTLVI